MKQLLILSGKGGTGKTTLASALIKLASAEAYADCDVDAPNLHLITAWEDRPISKDYYGLDKAVINPEACIDCDICRVHCRFDAISAEPQYEVDSLACEGCAVCEYVCPVGAIEMVPYINGELMLYQEERETFSTAILKMGSGTSGLLVSEVKKQLQQSAPESVEFAIIDGSPGIGCPVIASLSGVDVVLLVAEPSVSGISDLKRVVETAGKFGIERLVCINKYDTNHEKTAEIEEYCRNNNLTYVGAIPYDAQAVKAVNAGKTVVDYDTPAGEAVKAIYTRLKELMDLENV